MRILTEEELEVARDFRKKAFKGGTSFLSRSFFSSLSITIILTSIAVIDLTAIARTSSALSAPSPTSPVAVRHVGADNKQIPIHVSLHSSLLI